MNGPGRSPEKLKEREPFTDCRNVNGNELKREKHTVLPEREARGAAATR